MNETRGYHRHPSGAYGVTLFFFLVVQLGILVTVAQVGDRGINVYNLLILPLSALVGLLFAPRIEFTREAVRYVALSSVLLILIMIIRFPVVPGKVILAHVFVIGAAVATGILARETLFKTVLSSFLVAAVVVGVLDTLALLGVIKTGNTAAPVFPGTNYGGIGVATSFGTHGTVVGGGIVAAVGLFDRLENRLSSILLVISGWLLLMIIFSQSRSSLVATIIGISPVLAYRYREYLSRFSVSVGALILCIGGVSLVALRRSTVEARLQGILDAIEIVVSNPVTGIGWDVYYPVYSTKVLHSTPMNYFVADGLIVGLVFTFLFFYPLIVWVRQVMTSDSEHLKPLFTAVGLYLIVFIEISFYKSTPNVHMFAFGTLVCSVCKGINFRSKYAGE